MIPSFEKFMYPVLLMLKDGLPKQRDELRKACTEFMQLSKSDLEERISSNNKYKIVDRLQWATYYLMKAGLITRPSKAVEQITPEGQSLLQTGIKDITRQFLREHYEASAQFEKETRKAAKERANMKKNNSAITVGNAEKDTSIEKESNNLQNESMSADIANQHLATDDIFSMSILEEKELKISQDINSINEGLITELIGILNDFDEESFKNLLLELIPKMGYSNNFEEYSIEAKLAHDIAFSGFVNIDELGLNRFFVVAHNKIEEEITHLDVQTFIGTLSSLGISNGVYITTSDFTEEAQIHKMIGNINIKLIDGRELAKLMIKYNLGVKVRNIFEIKDVDQEYLFTHLTQG